MREKALRKPQAPLPPVQLPLLRLENRFGFFPVTGISPSIDLSGLKLHYWGRKLRQLSS
jgi:hypothetical protein